jgi:thioredoxin 1
MATVKITTGNFEQMVLKSDKTVILDFYADWCGPCQMVAPTLEKISNEHPEIVVGKINVDEEMPLAMQFGIESIPALFVMKEGKVTNKSIGLKTEEMILKMI